MANDEVTVGVEEEYQLVDAETFELRPRGEQVLADAKGALGERVQGELNLSQIEIGTPVCRTLEDVRRSIVGLRRSVNQAADESGSHIVALGTHPFSEWLGQSINPGARYQQLEEDYQQLARDLLVCGCHVHVAVSDPDLAIRIMDQLRPFIAPLLALSVNSPFWQGIDTGYASYRSELFVRWPGTGPPPILGSRAGFDDLVASLVRAGAVSDASFLYWDLRPSIRYPTLEFRMADVCLSVDEAVMLAGLARSLVRTFADRDPAGAPASPVSPEVLRFARWQASRYGMEAELVDPVRGELRSAVEVIADLLEMLRPDLEAAGEWDVVRGAVETIFVRGTGAQRQRAAFAERGSTRDVVALAIQETAAGL